MKIIQKKYQSHMATWHTSLRLFLIIVLFKTMVPVVSTLSVQLQTEPPGMLRLSTHNITARSLVLSWEPPTMESETTAYLITYSGVAMWKPYIDHTGSTTIVRGEVGGGGGVTRIVIDDLQPYTDYTIEVVAFSEAGDATGTVIEATTLQGIPSKPTNLRASSEALKTINTNWGEPKESNGVLGPYNISWYRGNQRYGHTLVNYPPYTIEGLSPCVEYRVRVAATTVAGEGEYREVTQIAGRSLSAQEITCSRDSLSQRVTVAWMEHDPNCPITSYDVIDRVANTTVTVNSSIVQHTLDVPLEEPLSQLCVASRMAGVRGEWTCCKDSERKDVTIICIFAGVVGGIVIIILITIFVCFRKKRPAKSASKDADYYENLIATVKRGIESLKHPAMAARHFEDLNKKSHVGAVTVAQHPSNRDKNIYSHILPFDCNRVKLQRYRSNTTEYINASFVKSPVESNVCFIACQSPKSNTIDDFWWMVWEQNVSTIVMLVRSDDFETTKSIQYWPGPGEEVCSSFTITIKKREVVYTLVKRKIQLVRSLRKRVIHHYQLISWPEFGVPNTVNELLTLIKHVREHIGRRRHHVVVHCGAGVGQTGTFIGLWHLQVQADLRLPDISVKDTVLEMRKHRQMLVQVPVQYQFLHDCFLAYLQDMQTWRPGSGRFMSKKGHISNNRRPTEGKESNQDTELPLLPQHPDFRPMPPTPFEQPFGTMPPSATVPLSATSDDHATKDELVGGDIYYYPDNIYDLPVLKDAMKEKMGIGTEKTKGKESNQESELHLLPHHPGFGSLPPTPSEPPSGTVPPSATVPLSATSDDDATKDELGGANPCDYTASTYDLPVITDAFREMTVIGSEKTIVNNVSDVHI